MICPKCGSKSLSKDGHVLDSQRFKCKDCGTRFTDAQRQRATLRLKLTVALLASCGASKSALAAASGVSSVTVGRWLKEIHDALGYEEPDGECKYLKSNILAFMNPESCAVDQAESFEVSFLEGTELKLKLMAVFSHLPSSSADEIPPLKP